MKGIDAFEYVRSFIGSLCQGLDDVGYKEYNGGGGVSNKPPMETFLPQDLPQGICWFRVYWGRRKDLQKVGLVIDPRNQLPGM